MMSRLEIGRAIISIMTAIQIHLRDHTREFAEQLVAGGAYSSVDEHIAGLIEAGQARHQAASKRLESVLLQAVNGGQYVDVDEAFWEERRKRHQQADPSGAKP
jgi:Arc/MetJ-type ribon-helix-helix transcriptional regulator